MKIKSLPKIDLPREKLRKYGVRRLADHELLAILLGSGIEGTNVLELSKKILKTISKIGREKITLDDLLIIKGLGEAKASQIIAVLGLADRLSRNKPEILTPEDVWKFCADFRESKKEHFAVFYIDTQSQLIERQIISIGILDSTLVHPREVFEPAIKLFASSIIIAHNHPSNLTEPSEQDREVTTRLSEASKLLGIVVSDHVIVTRDDFLSFREKRLLQ